MRRESDQRTCARALTSSVVPSDEGPHRTYHGITGTGRPQLEQQREEWDRFAGTVTTILKGER